mmetsp:Transcript_1344/g.1374  ORF Transcript_1344/g.1374 Transcript_1344/m.1374 type:complete len:357 (+) Transcript_1344:3-1073(+)
MSDFDLTPPIKSTISSSPNRPRPNPNYYRPSINRVKKTKIMVYLLSLYIVMDIVIRNELFRLSISNLKSLRSSVFYSQVIALDLTYIEFIATPYAFFIVTCFMYHICDQTKSLVFVLCGSFSIGLACLLKMLVNEPEPYYLDGVSCKQCTFDYGNPSLPAVLSVSMYISLWDLLTRQYHINIFTRYIFLLLAALVIVTVGLALFYTGNATYNQILNGWVWGYVSYFLICDIVYYEICKFVNRISESSKITLMFYSFVLVYFFVTMIVLVILFINDFYHPVPQDWKFNYAINCQISDGAIPVLGYKYLSDQPMLVTFQNYLYTFFIIGAYTGIIIEQKQFHCRHYPYFFVTDPASTF